MNIDSERDFFDSVLDSVIAVDKEGRMRDLNQATLKLLGYSKKEELAMLPMEKVCKDFSLKGLRDKVPLQEQELIYLHKDREKIPVSVNISNRTAYPDDLIFMARDITKIKELINELTISQEELKASYAELQAGKDELIRSEKLAYTGRIAASIAHELRNPLTNVAISVQQFQKTISPKDPENKYIEIMERNMARINFLITELLNSARPPKLDIRPYDIHRVLREVLDSVKTKIDTQRIKVREQFAPKISKINIDREHIGRAFLNIILNAIEAMPKGGELAIATGLDGNFFMVRIQDTGKGISEKDIIKIFDPFFSTKPEGTGLGLTVCYGIIVSHGGTIEVESKPGKGSTFTISLLCSLATKSGGGI